MKQLRESSTYRVLHEDEVELLKLQFAAEGEAKGKKEGLKEGEEIGLEKGKAEGLKEVAKRLLGLGQSVEFVAKATGLGKKVVEAL